MLNPWSNQPPSIMKLGPVTQLAVSSLVWNALYGTRDAEAAGSRKANPLGNGRTAN
jgi:hypothetical protein